MGARASHHVSLTFPQKVRNIILVNRMIEKCQDSMIGLWFGMHTLTLSLSPLPPLSILPFSFYIYFPFPTRPSSSS
jgi:hypothetical protein